MGKVLHASASGHFPFCILEIDFATGSGTDRPLGMNIETAMKFFWVFRSFSVSRAGLTAYANFTPDVPIDQEEQYVCPIDFGKFCFANASSSEEVGPNLVNKSVGVGIIFENPVRYKVQNGQNIFYPLITISADETSVGPDTYGLDSTTFKTNQQDPLAFSLAFFDFGQLDFYTGFQSDGSVPVSFSDPSYHSYSGTWDTSTGQRL